MADELELYDNAEAFSNAMMDTAISAGPSYSSSDGCYELPDRVPTPDSWSMASYPPPENPNPTMASNTPPPEPTIDDIVVGTISGIPAFDVPTLYLDLPSRPDQLEVPDFGSPNPIEDPVLPGKPIYTAPDLPVFYSIELPAVPILSNWSFEGQMPSDTLVDPVNTFSFDEVMYSSELSDVVKAKLIADVLNGGTGLGEAIENAIWDREEERALHALQEAKDRVSDEWAARGFTLPDGVLSMQLQELEKQYNDARLTSGRDIAVKQAELAQTNTHFTLDKSISFEGQLMTYTSQMCQRTLDAAKARIDATVAIFNAQVAKYNVQMEAYKVQAQVYEIRIRASLAQVEIYKAQIDAAKLTSELNSQLIQLYTAQWAGVEAMIKCYATEMEAAKIQTDVERLKLEAFKAQIDVQTAILNANLMEFQAYEAGIKGELAKAQMYGEQVQAYKARVESAKIEADILIETAKVESEVQKNVVAAYASNVEAYKAKVEAEKARVMTIVEAFKGEVEAYKAETEAEAARITAIVNAYQAEVQQYGHDINYVTARGKSCTDKIVADLQAAAHLRAAALQASAQISAAELGRFHESETRSEGHSYDETAGVLRNSKSETDNTGRSSDLTKGVVSSHVDLSAGTRTNINKNYYYTSG